MKKLIVALIVVMSFPMVALAGDDMSRFYNSVRAAERANDQNRRERINDNMGDAINNNDRRDMQYHQREMEQQLLQERIMSSGDEN